MNETSVIPKEQVQFVHILQLNEAENATISNRVLAIEKGYNDGQLPTDIFNALVRHGFAPIDAKIIDANDLLAYTPDQLMHGRGLYAPNPTKPVSGIGPKTIDVIEKTLRFVVTQALGR